MVEMVRNVTLVFVPFVPLRRNRNTRSLMECARVPHSIGGACGQSAQSIQMIVCSFSVVVETVFLVSIYESDEMKIYRTYRIHRTQLRQLRMKTDTFYLHLTIAMVVDLVRRQIGRCIALE